MERKTELILIVGILAAVVTGIAAGATIFGTTSGQVVWDAPNGPEITTTGTDVTESVPIRNSVVDLGMIDVTGPAGSSATLSSVDGSETTISKIDDNGGTIWADHQSAQRIGVEGVDSVTWDQIDLDVDQTEITTTGTGTIYVDGFEPDQYVRVDKSGTKTIQQADGSGQISLSVSGDDLTFLRPSAPELFNQSPVDEQKIDQSPVTLQVDVEHDDFGAETVDVVFELNGNQIETVSTTQSGTISVDTSAFSEGTNTWTATATDSTGNTTSVSGSFATPATLEIRDELSQELVNDTQTTLNVTFFGSEGSVTTRETSTGKVDMSGLPLDESFTVQVEADGYLTRQSFARSVVERDTIYLLNSSTETVSTQFEIDDPTGQYDQQSTRIFVKKPIEKDTGTVYEVVVSDYVGPGGWTTELAKDERYLIEVEDASTGRSTEVGPYVASVSERVPLEIDELEFDFAGSIRDGQINYEWNAGYLNQTGPAVDFAFQADARVDRLHVEIYQQHNENNVILNETIRNHEGPIDLRALVPESVENPDQTNWNVEWEATIDGEKADGSRLVGSGTLNPNFPGVGNTVLSIVGVLSIFVVAGFFSQANVSVGAIATSLVAGALWFVGVIPDAVSGIFIAVALMVGVMYHVQRGPQAR
jgi:hypothetical protein